jgi:hypothetical protein
MSEPPVVSSDGELEAASEGERKEAEGAAGSAAVGCLLCSVLGSLLWLTSALPLRLLSVSLSSLSASLSSLMLAVSRLVVDEGETGRREGEGGSGMADSAVIIDASSRSSSTSSSLSSFASSASGADVARFCCCLPKGEGEEDEVGLRVDAALDCSGCGLPAEPTPPPCCC